MLTEYAGNLSHPLEFGHVLEIVAKSIDGASRQVVTGVTKHIGVAVSVPYLLFACLHD